jgi:hypothetical protein
MGSVTAPAVGSVRRGRRIAFLILLWILVVFAVGFGLFSMVAAAFGLADEREIHRFHDLAGGVALTLLIGVPAVSMLRNTEHKVAEMQSILLYVLSAVVGMLLAGKVSPFVFPVLAFAVALAALHPARARLFKAGAGVNWPVAVLTVASAVPLIAYGLTQSDLQRHDPGTEHGKEDHWMTQATIAFTLVLGGLLVSLRTEGHRLVAWALGTGAIVLGAGSLALGESYPSVFEPAWAWVTIAVAVAFLALVEWDVRRRSISAVPGAGET